MTRSISDVGMTWPQYLRREVCIDGRLVRLSPTQTEIMLALLLHRGEPVPLKTLIEAVWPDPDASPECEEFGIKTQINLMRSKRGVSCIRTCGGGRWMIESQNGHAPLFAPRYDNRRAA